jgi:hypothetical protein
VTDGIVGLGREAATPHLAGSFTEMLQDAVAKLANGLKRALTL